MWSTRRRFSRHLESAGRWGRLRIGPCPLDGGGARRESQEEPPWSGGGANGISLVEAQQAYLNCGAIAPEFVSNVRLAREDEVPDPEWHPYDPADGVLDSALIPNDEDQLRAEARGEKHWAAVQSALAALRAEAPNLDRPAVERRMREISIVHHLHYDQAEIELIGHLVVNDRWPKLHPLHAFAWALRHARSESLFARLAQLRHRPFPE
jgi:Cysteine-rich CPCC